jgi:hypothetical protein
VSELGWLIERSNGRPMWLYPQEDGIWAWTDDSIKAIRFARREDADAFVKLCDIDDAEAITEHCWAQNVVDSTCFMEHCKGKETYLTPIYCLNCKWDGFIRWTKGHHSYSLTESCPACSCMELKRK